MKLVRIFIVNLVSLLFLVSCSGGSFSSIEETLAEYNISQIPTKSDYPEDNAVILVESHDVKVEVTSNYDLLTKETVHQATILFNNLEDYADFTISLNSGERIEYIIARTIKPDGTVLEIPKEEFYISTGQSKDGIFYSDDQEVKFTFPGLVENCIIEYKYQIDKDYPFRTDVWTIQHYVPTIKNKFTLTVPELLVKSKNLGGAGWDWNYNVVNTFLDPPKSNINLSADRSMASNSVTFKWELKDIPAFKPDSYMGAHRDHLRYVKFAPSDWKSWNDISEWYYERFFEPQLVINSEIKNKAAEIIADETNNKEKVKKLYNFIQGLRYVAIELGDGSIKPTEPQVVLQREYGDCKDLSTLLIALLKSVDIDAKPAICLTASKGKLDRNFPSWNFNHMIVNVNVDNEEIWIDATVPHCELGELPYECEEITALVLNNDGTCDLKNTPSSKSNDNQTLINMFVQIKESGDAEFNVNLKYIGERNHSMRYYFSKINDEERSEYCQKLVADTYLNAQVSDIKFSDLKSISNSFDLKFKFTVGKVLQKQGDMHFLTTDPFEFFDELGWLGKEKRNYDLQFNYPYTIQKQITINYPETKFDLKSLPEELVVSSNELKYNKKFLSNNFNQLSISENFDLRTKTINHNRYSGFRESYQKIQDKAAEKIVLWNK